MKKLAIIGAGRMACIFAQNAKEMNIETHCFAWSEGAIAQKYVDFFHPISIFEKETILKKCKDIGIDGVVATTELTIAVSSYISNALGLNGNALAVSEQITDKYRNRETTRNIVGLHHPKYIVTNTIEDVHNSNLAYPMILKPTDKGGKKGISVVYTNEDLKQAIDYLTSEVGDGIQFIVEEYIDGGQEYSVESLAFHGVQHIIQITEKISSGPPHCVELGHHQPAMISDDVRKNVVNVLKAALLAIGIQNGPCHTEIKIKNDEIYLIEFNARPGGDHIAYPLTQLSTGYEYIKGVIKVAFDENPMIEESQFSNRYAGVLFVTQQTEQWKKLFDVCEQYNWCYKKNLVSEELQQLYHNDGYNTNFFIYCSNHRRPDFDNIVNDIEVSQKSSDENLKGTIHKR